MDKDDGVTVELSFSDREIVQRLLAVTKRWSAQHPALVQGAAEMAIGAAVLSWGVHSGAIEMGVALVGTAAGLPNVAGIAGLATGTALAVSAAKIIGAIGIVGMGGAVGVPVALLATGGSFALGALGYTVGDVVFSYLHAFRPQDFVASSGALGIGLFLLADGARRIGGDGAVRQSLTIAGERILRLRRVTADVVARSVDDLTDFERDAAVVGVAAVAGLGGVAAGSAYAASTVTLLGSPTLGSAALGLGLVSAPVWPVVVGGAAAVVGAGLVARRLLARREARR